MPLDQRVTVQIIEVSTVQGVRQERVKTDCEWDVWATIADATPEEVRPEDTERQQQPGRLFTVRWIDAVARARVSTIRVLDKWLVQWDAVDVRINDRRGRRRFLTIRAERSIDN